MSGKEERNQREKRTNAIKRYTLYGIEGEEGATMPALKVPVGVRISTHDYSGVLGLSFREKK